MNLTWIFGAFFGAIVGLGRAYLPEETGLKSFFRFFLKKGNQDTVFYLWYLSHSYNGHRRVIFHIVMYSYVRLAPLATKEAVTNMNVWVREVHGPNGSAPCGPWVLALVLLSLLTAFAGASVGPEPVVIIMPSVLYVAGCCCRNFCRFFLGLPEKADF